MSHLCPWGRGCDACILSEGKKNYLLWHSHRFGLVPRLICCGSKNLTLQRTMFTRLLNAETSMGHTNGAPPVPWDPRFFTRKFSKKNALKTDKFNAFPNFVKIHNLVAPPRLFLLVLKTSEENITKSSRPRSSEPFQAQTGHFSSPSLCKRVTSGPWICVNGSLPVPEICTNRWPLIPKYVFFFCFFLKRVFFVAAPVIWNFAHSFCGFARLAFRWFTAALDDIFPMERWCSYDFATVLPN